MGQSNLFYYPTYFGISINFLLFLFQFWKKLNSSLIWFKIYEKAKKKSLRIELHIKKKNIHGGLGFGILVLGSPFFLLFWF